MNDLQQQASDPSYSVWVSASAGTGKTKILTDRVLRLLISGVTFKKILCLTFTNAGAAEMQSRVISKLAGLANSNIAILENDLRQLLGKEPNANEISLAQTLYSKLLHSTDKLNIQTIHSFCQKTLQIFPFEVGISPNFQILDDIKAQEIFSHIRNQIYLTPAHNFLTNFFLTNFHEVTINDIYKEIIQSKIKFKKLFAKNNNMPNNNMSEYLAIDYSLQLSTLYSRAKSLLSSCETFLSTDKEIKELLLIKDGNKRKTILPSAIRKKYPELLEEIEHVQEEIFQIDQLIKTEETKYYSSLLCKLAYIFLTEYEAYKKTQGLLDYDDLIYLTGCLLEDKDARGWVLYKLEGGVEHLLVDEAQDTSQQQWQIITAIIQDFYNNKTPANSIFVVGDEKQSIFSFQGANLNSFNLVNENLKNSLVAANENLKNITLEWSYRSTSAIIDSVYSVLQSLKKDNPELFPADNPQILSFRQAHKGQVKVWPLVRGEKNEQLFWPLPEDHQRDGVNNLGNPEQLLAKQIADFISNIINSSEVLPSTNLPAKFGDFMILVRTRDDFTVNLINQLKSHSLDVEGIDRMTLNKNLSIMDLMSIAKFVILPEDDLNLANLLKSPVISLSDEQLQTIILNHYSSSLWLALQDINYQSILTKLNYLIDIYKSSNITNFFAIIVDYLGLRAMLTQANGFDSNDAINELISLSSNYADQGDSSLQGFIYWFESNEIKIKRDVESNNKIRVMTVHGSKGLQAPIVILCDTTSVPTNKNKFIWTDENELISSIQSANSPNFLRELKEKEQQKELQEYIRLLYVAMTRAEDQLIICGSSGSNKLPQNCWYEIISRAINIEEQQPFDKADSLNNLMPKISNSEPHDLKVITCLEEKNLNYFVVADDNMLPKNMEFEGNIANKQVIIFSPDRLLIDRIIKSRRRTYPATSPLITEDFGKYGSIFHKILEDSVKIRDFTRLGYHPLINHLSLKQQIKIQKNITLLLNNQEFTKLLEQELETEVNIGVTSHENIKTGRIDLLAISQESITIIDYKSDRNPPISSNLIPDDYINQLNFYRHSLQKIYPDQQIICKILWLESGKLMALHL